MQLLRLTTTDTVLGMPADGIGNIAAGVARGASTLTYTASNKVSSNTIDWSAGGAAVVGGVFISQEGFWGIITSVIAGVGASLGVDYWRDPNDMNHQPQRGTRPASGAGLTCYHCAKSHIADARVSYIKRIVVKVAGAASVEIVNTAGVIIDTWLLTAAPVMGWVEYTDTSPESLRGLNFNGPFRARLTAAAGGCEIMYDTI